MDIEEAVELFHELGGSKTVSKTLEINKVYGKYNFSLLVHAPKKEISKLMAVAVKRTGILLKKALTSNWQYAQGQGDNLLLKFYPRENVFNRCTIKKIKKEVWVEDQKAHFETKISYEAICDGEMHT